MGPLPLTPGGLAVKEMIIAMILRFISKTHFFQISCPVIFMFLLFNLLCIIAVFPHYATAKSELIHSFIQQLAYALAFSC